jgi:queuine tRNA-ribosyltransferase
MKMISPFKIIAKDKKTKARTGLLYTKSRVIQTPVFMPVATQGSVKAVSDMDLKNIGVECILSNAYHLYLRPGTHVLKKFGGLHKFMNWDKSILTDSGGFQVYSLKHLCKITQKGVSFKSHIDGSSHLFTPENVIEYQNIIGSDIWVCLDVCVASPVTKQKAKKALEITQHWTKRAIKKYRLLVKQKITRHRKGSFTVKNPLLFAIIQGSMYEDLRCQAALEMSKLTVHGFCIGGLAVGESKKEMYTALNAVTQNLPANKPRYFMGLGSPLDLWQAVELGVDMFDCVWPTRNARNGTVMTSKGRISIKNLPYRSDNSPLDEQCDCFVCKTYSKAYLSHLFRAGELLSHRLLSVHNIRFLIRTMEIIRQSIAGGTFTQAKKDFFERYKKNSRA